MHNESVLNVCTSGFGGMGYNLKKDGWLNSFIYVKNQSMQGDGVPWRGAHEKHPEFFSIIFSALADKDDILLDWQCGIGSFLYSLFPCLCYLCLRFFSYGFTSNSFPYPYLFAFCFLGNSIIACRSIQRHIVAFELDIDVFKSILLPICEPEQEYTSQQAAPQRGSVFAPPPRKMAKRNFDLMCV